MRDYTSQPQNWSKTESSQELHLQGCHFPAAIDQQMNAIKAEMGFDMITRRCVTTNCGPVQVWSIKLLLYPPSTTTSERISLKTHLYVNKSNYSLGISERKVGKTDKQRKFGLVNDWKNAPSTVAEESYSNRKRRSHPTLYSWILSKYSRYYLLLLISRRYLD